MADAIRFNKATLLRLLDGRAARIAREQSFDRSNGTSQLEPKGREFDARIERAVQYGRMRAMRAAQAAPAAVAVPDDRCQHCVNRSDGFYGSFAPECPLHNDDGTAHTQAAPQPVELMPLYI